MLNWEEGIWKNENAPEADAEVLIASDWAPIRAFDRVIMETPEGVYGDLLPVLRESDLRIVNLECPLCGHNTPVWKSGSVLKGKAEHVRGLRVVPFEVVTLGNNHVFDYGTTAFAQTLAVLEENGIAAVGAGMSTREAKTPLRLEVNGIRVGIVNFSEGEDLTAATNGPGVFGWEVEAVAAVINAIKASVDIVIVVCHCGLEYIPIPPPYVARAFRHLADAGAHLVVGHHPHVPQGLHIYHQVPICYSLGNFVFYQETDLLYRKVGFFVKAGLAKGAVAYLKLVPYGIRKAGLHLLNREERQWFLKEMRTVSMPLDTPAAIEDAWHGFLHYYGTQGLRGEIGMILEKMRDEPRKGAAMLRNRLTTMQHNQHWIDMLTRIMNDDLATSPQWAYNLAEKWLTAITMT